MNELKSYYDAYTSCWKLFRSAYEQIQAGKMSDDQWNAIIDQANDIGKSEVAVKIAVGTLRAISVVEKQKRSQNEGRL